MEKKHCSVVLKEEKVKNKIQISQIDFVLPRLITNF